MFLPLATSNPTTPLLNAANKAEVSKINEAESTRVGIGCTLFGTSATTAMISGGAAFSKFGEHRSSAHYVFYVSLSIALLSAAVLCRMLHLFSPEPSTARRTVVPAVPGTPIEYNVTQRTNSLASSISSTESTV